jgi:Raf kinase inhibitor-like YbhB/YbcL family protein
MTLKLTSSAFKHEGDIPVQHTCDGEDISPALEWSDVPEETVSLALLCDDPDAPRGTWSHWVLFHIPADVVRLPEGVDKVERLPWGGVQGRNDFGRIGYGGPCPPRGPAHRYFFRLFALDNTPPLEAGANRQALIKAVHDHIVAQAELMGRYRRR